MGIFSKFMKQSKTKDKTELRDIKNDDASKNDLLALSDAILLDTQTDIASLNTVSVPIGEMAALGGVVASFVEMMLLGNFQEEYVMQIKSKIEKYSLEYRKTFAECSEYLEAVVKNLMSKNALQGLGVVENALGSLIGNIPLVKDGQVDEWLIKNASRHKHTAKGIEQKAVELFSEISDPGTNVFIERLEEMNRIYNRTEQMFFDDKKIYPVAS